MAFPVVLRVDVFVLKKQITWHAFVLKQDFRLDSVRLLKVSGEFRPSHVRSRANFARKNSSGNALRNFFLGLCYGIRRGWQGWKADVTDHVGLQAPHRLESFATVTALAVLRNCFEWRWCSGGPDFDSWLVGNPSVAPELRQSFELLFAALMWALVRKIVYVTSLMLEEGHQAKLAPTQVTTVDSFLASFGTFILICINRRRWHIH